jgi:DNA primase
MIPEETIADILRRTDIVQLIGGYLPLKAAGRTFKGLCPFHTEKTPSFVVNPERQIFHCFGCGEGGDAIAFLVKHERLTFLEAVRYLAQQAGVTLPASGRSDPDQGQGRLALLEIHREALAHFRENLRGDEGAAAREYLAGRGLDPALVERFQFGYALARWDGLLRALRKRGHPEKLLETAGLIVPRQSGTGYYDRFRHRLMLPIWDVAGHVIGFGGRALEAQEVKYLNSPETPLYRKGTQLYGLNLATRAIREANMAIVVEGYFDALMLHAHGFEHAVATLGTALTTEQARLLGRYTSRVTLLFDPDAAGIGAARRNLEHLINVDLDWRVVVLPGGLDPDAFVRANGAAAFTAVLETAQDLVTFFLDRRVSGLDMADPVQRARAADALVEILAGIDNPIRREGYVQTVARRTPITDRSLLEAVARQRAKAGRQDAAAQAARPAPMPPTAEEHLIYIALTHPEWRERIAGAVGAEEIRDPILRRIYADFIQSSTAQRGVDRPLTLSGYPPELQRRLSWLWAWDPWSRSGTEDEAPTPREAEELLARTVDDCLSRLARTRAVVERQALRQALEGADRRGDPDEVLRLLAEHPSVKHGREST